MQVWLKMWGAEERRVGPAECLQQGWGEVEAGKRPGERWGTKRDQKPWKGFFETEGWGQQHCLPQRIQEDEG